MLPLLAIGCAGAGVRREERRDPMRRTGRSLVCVWRSKKVKSMACRRWRRGVEKNNVQLMGRGAPDAVVGVRLMAMERRRVVDGESRWRKLLACSRWQGQLPRG